MALPVPRVGLASMMKEGAKVRAISTIKRIKSCVCRSKSILISAQLAIARRSLTCIPYAHTQHFSGMDEAIFRNIHACKELSKVTRSSYGPNGMNKMVINHLEKLFVTNDAATVIRELEVEHPAAKMLVMATKMMEQEVCVCVCVYVSEVIELGTTE